jgi:hypothetical protein
MIHGQHCRGQAYPSASESDKYIGGRRGSVNGETISGTDGTDGERAAAHAADPRASRHRAAQLDTQRTHGSWQAASVCSPTASRG